MGDSGNRDYQFLDPESRLRKKLYSRPDLDRYRNERAERLRVCDESTAAKCAKGTGECWRTTHGVPSCDWTHNRVVCKLQVYVDALPWS
jgi:hypothetical protein